MHVIRRKRRWQGGEATYLLLRSTYRVPGGSPKERNLHLGPEKAADLIPRATKTLRRTGYTPKQIETIVAAVRARVERNEHVPIAVRGKPVVWRDPKK